MNVLFENSKCIIKDHNKNIVVTSTRKDELYRLHDKSNVQKPFAIMSSKQKLWYEQMEHLNYSKSLVDT